MISFIIRIFFGCKLHSFIIKYKSWKIQFWLTFICFCLTERIYEFCGINRLFFFLILRTFFSCFHIFIFIIWNERFDIFILIIFIIRFIVFIFFLLSFLLFLFAFFIFILIIRIPIFLLIFF